MWLELARRSAWLALGSAVGRMAPLLILIVASRRFDAAGFATVSACFAWAGVAVSISSAGLATVLTQRLGSLPESSTQRTALIALHWWRSLGMAGLLALLLIAIGPYAIQPLFRGNIDTRIALPAALAGACWSQVVVVVAAFNGCHDARSASVTVAACGLLQGLAMVLALAAFNHPIGMAWGAAAGSGAALSMAVWQLRCKFGADVLATHLKFSVVKSSPWRRNPVLWHSVASCSVLPVTFFASSVIAQSSDSRHQLALYFSLEQIFQVIAYLPAIMGQALLPLLSQRLHKSEDPMEGRLLVQIIVQFALVGVGVALAVALAAFASADLGWFSQILGNRAITIGDSRAVHWMLCNALLTFSLSLLGGAMLGRGQIALAGKLNLMWALLFACGTWVLKADGAAGLFCSRSLAALLLIAATAFLLRQSLAPIDRIQT